MIASAMTVTIVLMIQPATFFIIAMAMIKTRMAPT